MVFIIQTKKYINPLFFSIDIKYLTKKMANTKSIQKVLEYLRKKERAVSVSDIALGVNLKWKTIKEVLDILKQTNQVIILSSGKTTLTQFKRGIEDDKKDI